jgi:hypothetical protein
MVFDYRDRMNILALRSLLRPIGAGFKDQCTDVLIPKYCADLGLPVPEEADSKRERWHAAFDALGDQEVLRLRRAWSTRVF